MLFATNAPEAATAQPGGQAGEIELEVRQFDDASLENLRNDPDLSYETAAPARIGLWDKIKWFLSQIFGWLLSSLFTPGGPSTFKIIVYVILAAVMVYVALRLLKVDMRGLFFSTRATAVPFEVVEEDIHEMDFNALIAEAVSGKQYRKAIRYYYLFALKKLADKQMIRWSPGKTNHEYAYEIENAVVKERFNLLSYYFEYAWYGDFDINERHFRKISSLFHDFKEPLV